MSTAGRLAEAGTTPGAESAVQRRYVYGLDVEADIPFEAAIAPNGRREAPVTMERVGPEIVERRWSRTGAASFVALPDERGRLGLGVDHHPESGYRVYARGYGLHLVSADGRRILSAIPAGTGWRWQRLLFSQVLPIAAVLNGREVFHASAVAIGSRVFGFVAASGTGKSSVAAQLVAKGASFVTDDVLPLEVHDGQVRAHAGPGASSLYAHEFERLPHDGVHARARVLGVDEKVFLATEPIPHPLPLGGLYYLKRVGEHDRFLIADARLELELLLSSAFLAYLNTPDRLSNYLDVCARIQALVPVFVVSLPGRIGAADAAARLMRHAARTWAS